MFSRGAIVAIAFVFASASGRRLNGSGQRSLDPTALTTIQPQRKVDRDERLLTAADVVRSAGPLTVAFGRDTAVPRRRGVDLRVQPGDRCTATVAEAEAQPAAHRVGRLRPRSFPCHFADGELTYTHRGLSGAMWDRIRLLIKYDGRRQTLLIPITIDVEVSPPAPYVVVRLLGPLQVTRPLDLSTPVDARVIEFSYDRSTQDCRVSLSDEWSSYGVMANGSASITDVDCDDFLRSNVRYLSKAVAAAKKDRIAGSVTVRGRNQDVIINTEHFQIDVNLLFGAPNEAPSFSLSALMNLEVNQFILTAISPDVLQAEDKETSASLLIFNVTRALDPEEGQIVSIDDHELPIRSFYQQDVQQLRIAFKPPASDSDVPRHIRIPVQAMDSEGLSTDTFDLIVTVNPMDTLAPLVTRNLGLTLFEGESRQLSSANVLQVADEDNLADVRIRPLRGPVHGRLHVLAAPGRDYFTAADLDESGVVYEHDGSDSYNDNIIFCMSDGRHEVQFLFPIIIYPTDDSYPMLTANTGMQTYEGTTQHITLHQLSAYDFDSDPDGTIIYVLQQPFSDMSEMVLRVPSQPPDARGWTRSRHFWERRVVQWTQLDLQRGHLMYRHKGRLMRNSTLDVVRFRLRDTTEPPNESPVHEFLVQILPQDLVPPERCRQDLTVMTANESELTVFTRKHLCYSDDDSDDRSLVYTITRSPFTTTHVDEKDFGQIVFTDTPSVVATTFKQSHINYGKIAYVPPFDEVGIAPRMVEFYYTVADPAGNEQTNQIHRILLQPVDNKPPRVLSTGVTVYENGYAIIMPTLLYADDPDTKAEQIAFTMILPPAHGTLRLTGQPMYSGHVFRKKDIETGSVTYMHSGSEAPEDFFDMEVSDGVHVVPVRFRIAVIPVDDESPFLVSGQHRELGIVVNEGGSVVLAADLLSARDNDTDQSKLTFIVESQPRQGYITAAGKRATAFTVLQVHKNVVFYHHDGSEVGQSDGHDSFILSLTDQSEEWDRGGNTLRGIAVEVTVKPVDDQRPEITVGSDLLVVTEGSFCGITMRHVTVADVDSPEDVLVCSLATQPSFGFIEIVSPGPGSEISRKGIPASAFYWEDIKRGSVNYVQSIHQGIEPTDDSFVLTCSDGRNVSPEQRLRVIIRPHSDEVPVLHVREFVVLEGHRLTLDTPLLNAEDADIPQDQLQFKIAVAPRHGRIASDSDGDAVDVSRFTLAEILRDSRIFYEHDNSETVQDSFALELTDGIHSVVQTISILVIPVDDETPRLSINNGLDLERPQPGSSEPQWKLITNRDLMAEDLDSNNKNITFLVRQQPVFGVLQRYNPASSEWDNVTRSLSFQQWEIDEGHIRYVHAGRHGVRDLVKFDISDPAMNKLVDRYFYINVEGIDLSHPNVVSKGIDVPESNSVIITTDVLSASDDNSPVEYLHYTITRAPTKGYLVLTDFPGQPVSTFTQLHLAGSKLRYVHNHTDESLADHFEFEVSDGFNPVHRTFKITLLPINNKLPVLRSAVIRVNEGGTKVITPFELDATDKDTDARSIVVSVVRKPKHGTIFFGHKASPRSFTVDDVRNGRVTYRHDGSETVSDSFSITVSDGAHSAFYVLESDQPTSRAQQVHIEVLPVDDSAPRLSINRGVTGLRPLSVAAGHGVNPIGFCLDDSVLKVEDLDTAASHLTFTVLSPPRFGKLVRPDEAAKSVSSWTQENLNTASVCYVLNDGVEQTEDAFFFTVTDKGGNSIGKESFTVTWSFVRFGDAQYTCFEAEKKVAINLTRRGHLDGTAFVALQTRNSTARAGLDFSQRHQTQVQFSPGEIEKSWTLSIVDDMKYEEAEQFFVEMADPVDTLIEGPRRIAVTIFDPEDESVVFLDSTDIRVEESIRFVNVTVRRTADVSDELFVICATEQGTAKGSAPGSLRTGTDYITRTADFNSVLRFDVNETAKPCLITLIDDTLYEADEDFTVMLLSPLGGKLGSPNVARVTILADRNDEPVVYFEQPSYEVDEGSFPLTVSLRRSGTDLSHVSVVSVRSRRTDPPSAEHGSDYIAVSRAVQFAKDETLKYFNVFIVDDLAEPRLEGKESFRLHLLSAQNASVGHPNTCLVTIDDSVSDLPSFEFAADTYTAAEGSHTVIAIITRTGDVSLAASVRCYTRQATARAGQDYVERPDTDASLVYFASGETEKPCRIAIVDDSVYERTEDLRVVLGSARLAGSSSRPAAIGSAKSATILIEDDSDKPRITFAESIYEGKEPLSPDDVSSVVVTLVRKGDTTGTAVVRLYTRDGSAKTGQDYAGYSADLVFSRNELRKNVELTILYDTERESKEFFFLMLQNDRSLSTARESTKATIYIEESKPVAQVTFPTAPVVVSLKDYEHVAAGSRQPPVPGYPVICISSCHPRHPDFLSVSELCLNEKIDDSATRYRWFTSTDEVIKLEPIVGETYFSSGKEKTLDSIYFRAGSYLQCRTRAVSLDGDVGLERASAVVKVDQAPTGACPTLHPHDFGAEPFRAKIRYTGLADVARPNSMRLSVTIPHRDGMLPVISTHRLSNFDFTLSKDSSRIGQHRCSNVVGNDEVHSVSIGFLSGAAKEGRAPRGVLPHQFDISLRQPTTVQLYRNLDLTSCQWDFVAFYSISELLDECGAKIETDSQVYNSSQSFVTLSVPLYVSYVYYSANVEGRWQSTDLHSSLPITFAYDTSILWQSGIACEPGAELKGTIYPTSMRIRDDGRLAVTFKSRASFRGIFLAEHRATGLLSSVTSQKLPESKLHLALLRSQPTFDQPEQLWEFVTDVAMRDYTDTYSISLVPCTVAALQPYSVQAPCPPRQHVIFKLGVRLQQVSEAVPAEFTLNTDLRLMARGTEKVASVEDVGVSAGNGGVAFGIDDKVYGRILLEKAHSLGQSLRVAVEKVFVCCGRDGYVPKYQPQSEEFGCVAPSLNLQHQFKIIDKNDPSTAVSDVHGVPFNASLTEMYGNASTLGQRWESDGFSFDCRPLFTTDASRPWFVHVMYSIKSTEKSSRGIRGRRSDERPTGSTTGHSTKFLNDVKDALTGTNMARLLLKYPDHSSGQASLVQNHPSENFALIIMCGVVGGSMIFVVTVAAITTTLVRRNRRHGTAAGASATSPNDGCSPYRTSDAAPALKPLLRASRGGGCRPPSGVSRV